MKTLPQHHIQPHHLSPLVRLQGVRSQGGFAFIILLSISVSLLLAGNLLIKHYGQSNSQITSHVAQQQLRAAAESAAATLRLRLHTLLIQQNLTPSIATPAPTNSYITNCQERLGVAHKPIMTGGSASSDISLQANQASTVSSIHTSAAMVLDATAVAPLTQDYYLIIACAHRPDTSVGQGYAVAQSVQLDTSQNVPQIKSLGFREP